MVDVSPNGPYGRAKLSVNLAPQTPLEIPLPGISSGQDQWNEVFARLLAQIAEETHRIARALERR
jgi:hypothetical protein